MFGVQSLGTCEEKLWLRPPLRQRKYSDSTEAAGFVNGRRFHDLFDETKG